MKQIKYRIPLIIIIIALAIGMFFSSNASGSTEKYAIKKRASAPRITLINTVDFLIPGSYDSFVEEGTKLVVFWAPWCEDCIRVIEELNSLPFQLGLVNIENPEENFGIAKYHDATNLPCVILYHEGTVAYKWQGNPKLILEASLDEIKEILEEL